MVRAWMVSLICMVPSSLKHKGDGRPNTKAAGTTRGLEKCKRARAAGPRFRLSAAQSRHMVTTTTTVVVMGLVIMFLL